MYRHLVNAGLLVKVNSDTWSLGIPTLHMFIKTFNIGRNALLTVINKSKYYEITEQVRYIYSVTAVMYAGFCNY